MKLLPWNGVIRQHRRAGPRDRDRRPRAKLNPLCEALDDRRMLSTVAAVLSVPPAPAVATATATLNALNPTAFAQFQTDLAKAESQSRVTSAQVRKLARDEKIIDQTIESYSPDANTTSTVVNEVQTDVDNAFLETDVTGSLMGPGTAGIESAIGPGASGRAHLVFRHPRYDRSNESGRPGGRGHVSVQ